MTSGGKPDERRKESAAVSSGFWRSRCQCAEKASGVCGLVWEDEDEELEAVSGAGSGAMGRGLD
jgi:hypothetical protein